MNQGYIPVELRKIILGQTNTQKWIEIHICGLEKALIRRRRVWQLVASELNRMDKFL